MFKRNTLWMAAAGFAFLANGPLPLTPSQAAQRVAYSPSTNIPHRMPDKIPIWIGEKHELDVAYLGITGLHVTFEVLGVLEMQNRKVFHTKGTAIASSLVDLFFTINNTVESWIDYYGLFSYQLHLVQNQSNLFRDSWEIHDPLKGESQFKNRMKKKGEEETKTEKTYPSTPFAQDSMSAFYFLRTQPIHEGSKFIVPVISEGSVIQVLVTGLKEETMEYQDNDIPCYVVKLEKLDPQGKPIPAENRVWLSKDDRRFLVKMDVKARFGHVIAETTNFTPGKMP